MPNRPHTLIESWLLFDAISAESLLGRRVEQV